MQKQNYLFVPHIGIAIVLIWMACMKFTTYEANAISGFIKESPFISWVYNSLSLRAVSSIIGVTELVTAILILVGIRIPKLGLFGGLGAIATFVTTLSFMLTTPGVWEASLGGFPALSVLPGQFLIKDVTLLFVSIYITFLSIASLKSK